MLLSSLNLPNPQMMVLGGGGAFGVCFSHEGGAFVNGISAPIKSPQKSLVTSTVWGQKEVMVLAQETRLSPERDQAGALILGFPAFRMVRNRFCL